MGKSFKPVKYTHVTPGNWGALHRKRGFDGEMRGITF